MPISKIVGEYEVYTRGDPNHFRDLPEDIQEKSLIWLKANVLPRKTPLLQHGSYGLKHLLHAGTDIYMTNNQFKEAMLLCGFKPVNEYEWRWCYCISKKSPIFKRRKDGRTGLLMPECVIGFRPDYPEFL